MSWSKEQQEAFNKQVAEHDAEQQAGDNDNQQFEIAPVAEEDTKES